MCFAATWVHLLGVTASAEPLPPLGLNQTEPKTEWRRESRAEFPSLSKLHKLKDGLQREEVEGPEQMRAIHRKEAANQKYFPHPFHAHELKRWPTDRGGGRHRTEEGWREWRKEEIKACLLAP